MSATGINHVSIHAIDLDASEAFYGEFFGLARIPTPDFGHAVRWLKVGGTQLHLFNGADEAPANHHFAFTVDDLAEVYRKAQQKGILDRPEVRRLPDGSAQMYLRDPSGNLIECNAPDADSLDTAVVGQLVRVGGEDGARLFL